MKTKPTQSSVCIDAELLNRIQLSLIDLIAYIECVPVHESLKWFVDGKTLVKSLPGFKQAKAAEQELSDAITRNSAKYTIPTVRNGRLDDDDIAVIKEHARELKSEVDQLLDAVGIIGGV